MFTEKDVKVNTTQADRQDTDGRTDNRGLSSFWRLSSECDRQKNKLFLPLLAMGCVYQRCAVCSWFCHSHRVFLSAFCSLFLVLPQPQGISVSVVQSVPGSATATGYFCQRSAVISWFCHRYRVFLSAFCSLFLVLPQPQGISVSVLQSVLGLPQPQGISVSVLQSVLGLPQPQGISVSVLQSVLGSATATGYFCQRSAVCSWSATATGCVCQRSAVCSWSATAIGYFCQRSAVCSWVCHSHRVFLSAFCSLFLVCHSHRVCLSVFCSLFLVCHSHRVFLSVFCSLFLGLPQPQGISVSVL